MIKIEAIIHTNLLFLICKFFKFYKKSINFLLKYDKTKLNIVKKI